MKNRIPLVFGTVLIVALSVLILLASFGNVQASISGRASRLLDIETPQAVPPTLVAITGPLKETVGYSVTLTASVEPISSTLPITYSWQVSTGQAITHVSNLSDVLTWPGHNLARYT